MSGVREISIELTDEQFEALKAAVDCGDYPNQSEVVREALREWQLKREARRKDIEKLRQLWDEGIASGPAEPLDFGELRREARLRLKAIKKAAR